MYFAIGLIRALIKEAPRNTVMDLAVLDYIVDNEPTSVMEIGLDMFGDKYAGQASLHAYRWELLGATRYCCYSTRILRW